MFFSRIPFLRDQIKGQSLYLKVGKFESHVICEFEIGPTQQKMAEAPRLEWYGGFIAVDDVLYISQHFV